MTKICFIIPTVSSGGIETYLLRFLRFLDADSQISVIVRSETKGDLYQAYRARDIDLLFMPLGYLNPGKALTYYLFFRRNRFDVVCDFNANFSGLPILLAKLAGVKKRMSFYRQGSNHFKPNLFFNAYNSISNRMVYMFATNILSNSLSALDFFFSYRSQTDRRFNIIYNGVELSDLQSTTEENNSWVSADSGRFVIGHVGRFDPAKNHDAILQIASRLVTDCPSCHFILCGSGTEKLEGKIAELKLLGHFTLLGFRSNVHEVYKSFDVFLFPSITEGQPNALIEAMILGVPFVASNISPISEILPDSFHQYLRNPHDVDGYVSFIKDFMAGKVKFATEELKAHAEKNFNKEINFNFFKEILSGV
ncbi:MAG: glycosyltransferase [Fulvivirga sp.]